MKVLPQVPGHFTHYEWIALAVWVGLGRCFDARLKQITTENTEF